jgi:Ca-activated chloride channel family protein
VLTISTEWNQPCRGLAGSQTLYLAVRLRPATTTARGRVRAIILLDASGSMAGDKLVQARAAIEAAWEAMEAGDTLTVLTFSSRVETALPETVKGQAPDGVVAEALAGVQASGVTLLDEALTQAFRLAADMPADQPRFVWVVTDGDPTNQSGKPLKDLSQLLAVAGQGARQGITVGALGLGNAASYNANFLRDMSDRGGGCFCYAPAPQQLVEQFRERLGAAKDVSATQGELVLRLDPGNQVRTVARMVPEQLPLEGSGAEPHVWRIPLGGIAAPETVVLVELVNAPPLGLSPGSLTIGEVSASARFGSQRLASGPQPLSLEYAPGTSRRIYERNQPIENLRIAFEMARNAALRMESSSLSDKLTATQRLVELSRRTGDAATIARYEQEQRQLEAQQALSPDQEAQAVVDMRATGKLPFIAPGAGVTG